MKPIGWIFYQSKHASEPTAEAHCCRAWKLKFELNFECSNIVVSDNLYRANACELIASNKSASFHFGLNTKQSLQGYNIIRNQVTEGYLILIFESSYSPSPEQVKYYYNQIVLTHLINPGDIVVPKRTKNIVRLTALGFTTIEIANALFLSGRGVDYHLEQAKKRLGANNKSALVFLAMQNGWFR
ncbi:helix-turn-helix transcriptional regulator [Shewanella youngdeokensis]|uniref:LuxR C-terminal-related transcriptional regulator n=1 Tax=Shewanella youngdeokensis TaxID=2999068 RepID=A0ABZ0K3L1_9GAMM|nr:LuxR C-terminal-related transcriptional regulator [Shewanella sp. DAU334]